MRPRRRSAAAALLQRILFTTLLFALVCRGSATGSPAGATTGSVVLLQSRLEPRACRALDSCALVCLQYFIVIDDPLLPYYLFGTQSFQHIAACNCPDSVKVSRATMTGSSWSSPTSVLSPFGSISLFPINNTYIGMHVQVEGLNCTAVYVVFSGTLMNVSTSADFEVGLLRRTSTSPASCVQPTCSFICGELVSASVTGDMLLVQPEGNAGLCTCNYGYAKAQRLDKGGIVAVATGMQSDGTLFNTTSYDTAVFALSVVQDGAACRSEYTLAVGSVFGVSPTASQCKTFAAPTSGCICGPGSNFSSQPFASFVQNWGDGTAIMCSGDGASVIPAAALMPANLSYLGIVSTPLVAVPNATLANLTTLLQLVVVKNLIMKIDDNAFASLTALKVLNLGSNVISHLAPHSFVGLSSLTELILSNNVITALPDGIFDHLTSLRSLLLVNNFLATLPMNLLVPLQHLGSLHIDSNMLQSLSEDLPPLPSLFAFHVSQNFITTISPSLFANAQAVNYLDFSGNALVEFPDDFCLYTPQLVTLRCSGNYITRLDGIVGHGANLVVIDFSDNLLTTVPVGNYSALESLLVLSLSNNLISWIPPNAFSFLPSVAYLDLSNNSITALEPGAFAGLNRLQQLILSWNPIQTIPVGLFADAFGETAISVPWSTWYYAAPLFTYQFLQQSPVLNFTGCPLEEIHEVVMATIPSNLIIVLTTATTRMQLNSCCGLEWLINDDSRFLSAPGTLTCGLNGTAVPIEALRGKIICPCIQPHLPPSGIYSAQSFEECQVLSTFKLLGTTCQSLARCPVGHRLQPVFGGRPVGRCVYANFSLGFLGSTALDLLEMKCEHCAILHCSDCPGDFRHCMRCNDGFFLYRANCVPACPPGMRGAAGNSTAGRFCQSCAQRSCNQCDADPSVCQACVTGPYSLQNGYCSPCEDPNCVTCTRSPDKCEACKPGLFVSIEGRCLSSCPKGQTIVNGHCEPGQSSGQSLSSGAVVGIVLASLVAVTMLVTGLLFVSGRKLSTVRSELMHRLLSTEEEVTLLKGAWVISASELQLERVIGHGAFGAVHAGQWRGISVAVKTVRPELMSWSDDAPAVFETEANFMRTVRHEHIVLFFGAGRFDDGSPFLVTELMHRGSLQAVLANSPTIATSQRYLFALDAASGMAHLHTLGRVHRDLKSGNLLVDACFRVKVADFGTARMLNQLCVQACDGASVTLDHSNGTMTTQVGTLLWMAPEVLQGGDYGPPADVFSYGVVLWEIWTQQLPWQAEFPQIFPRELLEALRSGRRPAMPSDCPPAYRDLITACWATEASVRPTFAQVMESPALRPSFSLLENSETSV